MTIYPRRIVHALLASLTLFVALASFTPASAAGPAAPVEQRIAKAKTDLTSSDVTVRRSAIRSLVHSDISAKLLPEMRTALDDHDAEVRAFAATAIGNLRAAAIDAIPQLIAQLKGDSAKEARETAARALGRIGMSIPDSKQLIDPLRTASQQDADPVTRVTALGALAMIDVERAGQILALRKYLHHEDPLVRMKAAHALGMIGKDAKAAAPEIVEVLKQETDGHRRGYVARALGNTADPASLPVLEAALEKETDAGAKGEMRGAISRLKALEGGKK